MHTALSHTIAPDLRMSPWKNRAKIWIKRGNVSLSTEHTSNNWASVQDKQAPNATWPILFVSLDDVMNRTWRCASIESEITCEQKIPFLKNLQQETKFTTCMHQSTNSYTYSAWAKLFLHQTALQQLSPSEGKSGNILANCWAKEKKVILSTHLPSTSYCPPHSQV